jgi:hypothetical protein
MRLLALAVTLVGLVGASAVVVPKGDAGPQAGSGPVLDPSVTAVRITLGIGDATPGRWNGSVKVDKGEILGVEGWRFRKGDMATGRDSWEARTHTIRKATAKKANAAAQKATGPSSFGPTLTPNGVIVSLRSPDDATLAVETDRGNFSVKLADLARGDVRPYLDGRASAQRVATAAPLVAGPDQDDFPAAVGDGKGGAWIAYVVHSPRGPDYTAALDAPPKSFAEFAPTGGGDQVKLLHIVDGAASAPVDVTAPSRDVWRPAVAVDGRGRAVVVWSENRDGNFDLYARRYDGAAGSWSDEARLTTDPGADTDPSLAVDRAGAVWVAWQSWAGGQADIRLRQAEAGAAAQVVSEPEANEWSPSLAADPRGGFVVAYDTYRAGNYDVVARRCAADGAPGPAVFVASTPRYEARPSVAVDPRGRAWVAYEERTENWGKDAENLVDGKGSTLYRQAAVRVKCIDGAAVLDAPDPVAAAPQPLKAMNSFPRLAVDPRGRVWLAFRHRQEAVWGNQSTQVVGGIWVEYVGVLAGAKWGPPSPLPRSDGLLDNRPALVAQGDGPLLVAYSSDGRMHREVDLTPELQARYQPQGGTPPGVHNSDLFLAAVPAPTGVDAGAAEPSAAREAAPAQAEAAAAPVHPTEAADVARMRGYRLAAGGKTYRLFRGDFHRHTELSMDGGSDGPLEDMWRYAIDAAGFDWMGNDDHDNGGGKEYTWWLAQKTTDLYQSPRLTTLFAYERSVNYPHGHRNVMFAGRGVRTLPRLIDKSGVVDADTAMLYDYLEAHGGICASHTSATGMGTDWRDVNPKYEPIVEIFQGHRNSYEHLGAPRVARRPGEAIGGWRPLGMVWNALAMQYRLGFQASSDHISTHISYTVAIAEDGRRESLVDAFRRRHCYGATDNILMDVRSGDHLMGDEFSVPLGTPVTLSVLVHGTRPVARVDVIKDFVYVYSTEPQAQRVAFAWTDNEARPAGLSWYYVRAIQDDGQLAWASPIWVQTRPNPAPR